MPSTEYLRGSDLLSASLQSPPHLHLAMKTQCTSTAGLLVMRAHVQLSLASPIGAKIRRGLGIRSPPIALRRETLDLDMLEKARWELQHSMVVGCNVSSCGTPAGTVVGEAFSSPSPPASSGTSYDLERR